MELFGYGILASFILGSVFIGIPKTRLVGKALLNLAAVLILLAAGTIFISLVSLLSPGFDFRMALYLVAIAVLAVALSFFIWGVIKKKIVYLSLLGITLLWIGLFIGNNLWINYQKHLPTLEEPENLLLQYRPYGENTKIVVLQEPADLTVRRQYPKLDGATALYPIYSAFARAIYPEDALNGDDYVTCSTTSTAYERLIDGEVDMIFVASASAKQMQLAQQKGVELTFTPIGKEAFVFFVNAKNPLETITVEQIQNIYEGEITRWSQLGVRFLGPIKAFQRDEGSGSQTALQKLMAGRELMAPPEENIVAGMGGIIQRTADYKNYRNALGFSFRFYATEMVKNNQIKLLRIEDIAPTKENIANGSYPIASEFYAVTSQKSDPQCVEILQWILSSQGQEIIERTGYVPIAGAGDEGA